MSDVIRLLPDALANQIAAGEVVQRPASVVKELLENAIDAGATQIKLVVKEAGRTLIQVTDNGVGMTETDLRMAFERHATSKIRQTEDLFQIQTMGFRGEALASIAAVAQVEVKTRQQQSDLGSHLVIEGSKVIKQEPCQCAVGTVFSVKNLFYNVPARRNFLKKNSVEMRHVLEEFQRVAMAHPELFFSLHHNGNEVFHLPPGKLRQRLVGIFGNASNKKLVPVNEDTDALRINGFVGKPEFAKKGKGEQFFFVNNRFIKSGYLHHAVMGAYEELLPKDVTPLYVLFIDIDPARIDINVHPTKQEIKFDDERLVYNYLKVSVRHALGQYSITPTLDFDVEGSFNPNFSSSAKIDTLSNTQQNFERSNARHRDADRPITFGGADKPRRESRNLQNWQALYDGLDQDFGEAESLPSKVNDDTDAGPVTIESKWNDEAPIDDAQGSFSTQAKAPYQIHHTYIVSQLKSGYVLIDQQAAHERILYEQYLALFQQQQLGTQQLLFPETVTVSTVDAEMLRSLLPDINQLGFDVREFGQDSFVVHGVPADMAQSGGVQRVFESLIEQFQLNTELRLQLHDNLARSLARSAATKRGQPLTDAEMQALIDKLFACAMPYKAPNGRKCFQTYYLEDLEREFRN